MKGIKGWIAIGVALLALVGAARNGSAEDTQVQRGLNWLQAQVRTDGSLTDEAGSLAHVAQARGEAAHTLVQGGRTGALPRLVADESVDLSTELLARRMIALAAGGAEVQEFLPTLLLRANSDGGFGGAVGRPSNPLDTSFALLAMRAAGLKRDTRVQQALGYLTGAAGADGSYLFGQTIYATGYALQALTRFRQDYGLDGAIQRTREALRLRQGADGYADTLENAVAAIALASSGPVTDVAPAMTALRNSQAGDGSWQGDPYLTALALRALMVAENAPSTNDGQVTGQVIDGTTGLPLGGALATVQGTALAGVTGADGRFTLEAVPPGTYSVVISRAGFAPQTLPATIPGGIVTDLGRIVLGLADGTAVLRGTVTDVQTQQMLAGATVEVAGAQSAQVQSDAQGRYELFGLAAGQYTISVTLTGYQTLQQTAELPSKAVVNFSPALTPDGEEAPTDAILTGLVVDAESGAGIAAARLLIAGQSYAVDAGGAFRIEGLPVGAFTATVEAEGYQAVTASGLLSAGENQVGRIALTKAPPQNGRTLYGTVTALATGQPIAGARVTANGGETAISAADGQYRIEGIESPDITLSASATGYEAQAVSLRLEQAGEYRIDLALESAPQGSFQVLDVRATPAATLPGETMRVTAELANLGGTSRTVLVLARIRSLDGEVMASVCGADAPGEPEQCEFAFDAGQAQPFVADWPVANLPAGRYVMAVHVIEPGSIQRDTPLGLILGQGTAPIEVLSRLSIHGAVVASPPAVIVGSTQGVQFAATVQNDGNDTIPAGPVRLQVRERATQALAHEVVADAPELKPSDIAELDFGAWVPGAGGAEYDLVATVVDPTVSGQATGELYVGDAAVGELTVTPEETGDGTQRVEATLTVTGIDTPTGHSADPLFTLVREAVTRGGAYTAANAVNWQKSNRCLGCHIQTQSLYGLGSSLSKADIDRAATLYLQNSQSASLQSDDSIYSHHPGFRRTSSMLGLWSMAAWPDREETFSARYRVANYLYGQRSRPNAAMAYWTRDHNTGWLIESAAPTATVVEGMASVLRDAEQSGITATASYRAIARGNLAATLADLDGGADGRLYLLRRDGQVHAYDPDLQTTVPYGTASAGAVYTSLAVAGDGSVYVASTARSGQAPALERVTPEGSVVVAALAAQGDSIDVAADGRVVLLNKASRTVYRVDPESGASETVTSGGLILPAPQALTAFADGSLTVSGSDTAAAYATVRVAADGQQSAVYEGGFYKLSDVAATPDGGAYAGGPNGIYVISPGGVIERFAIGNFLKVARAGDRLFGLGPNTTQFAEIERVETNIAPRLAEMRAAVEAGARYFEQVGTSSSLPNEAFRLIVLAEARPYLADAALAVRVDARIEALAEFLRSKQRADGGWGRYASYTSDPLSTAIIGTALDYLAPTSDDPVLRKTVAYLLGTQRSDGSWSGQYFSTRLGATSYVMAYLPKAVGRLSGIEVDLALEFAPDVALVSASSEPTSTTRGADGSIAHEYDLGRVNASGAQFDFTLDLLDLRIDEHRPIARSATLRFLNSFNGDVVEVPIAIPTVHARNGYALALVLDRSEFHANEVVDVRPTVRNLDSVQNAGSLRYFIETAEGQPVTELPPVSFDGLTAGGARELPQPWNTGTTAAGDYRARVVLLGPDGRVWGEATQPFRILTTAVGPELDSAVATDQPEYDPFETVLILGKVRNLTLNAGFENLSVSETVHDPAGAEVFSGTRALAQLAAGHVQTLELPYGLTAAPPGQYAVTQVVRDAVGAVLDTRATTFRVRSSADTGMGLEGTIAALPGTVEQGASVSLPVTARNAGNADLLQLPLVVTVVDPQAETVLATWTQVVDLPLAAGTAFSLPWNTTEAAPGRYEAVLQAQLGERRLTLAHAPITVIEPPVKADMSQALTASGRVLLLVTCRIGQGAAEDAACVGEREFFLDALLTRLQIEHTIVSTTDAFAAEYATGRYDTYWISGGARKLANTLAEEVREAVFQGDGLLVDGNHDSRNQILDTALGVKHVGELAGDAHAAAMAPGEFDVGRFDASGDALRYESAGAEVRGGFDTASGSPAFLTHRYGAGRGAVAAFDLVAALARADASVQAEALLIKALSFVLPEGRDYGVAGGYTVLRTTVINQARTAELILDAQAGAPLRIEDARPETAVLSAQQAEWRFELPEDARRAFDLGLRLPREDGVYEVETTLWNAATSASAPLQTARMSVPVASPGTLTGSLVEALESLALAAPSERNARTRVVELLRTAALQQADGQRDAAVASLLKTVDELGKIESVDMAPYHVQIAELIKAARVSGAG